MPIPPAYAHPICTARLPSGVEHAAQFRVPGDMPAVDLIGVGVRRYDAVLDLLLQVEPVVVTP